MQHIVDAIKRRRNEGGTVFICGNGGSGSTAEHFANDLFAKGVRAVCLNSNTAIMTMIANDYGYRYVFSRQMHVFADPKDLLVLISASGKSHNIQQARTWAKMESIETVEMFGLDLIETTQEVENRHLHQVHWISGEL